MGITRIGDNLMSAKGRALLAVVRRPEQTRLREPSRQACDLATTMHTAGATLPEIAKALDAMGENLPRHYVRLPGHSRWHKAAVRQLLDSADTPAPTTAQQHRQAAQDLLDGGAA